MIILKTNCLLLLQLIYIFVTMEKIGQNIRRMRELRGYSQESLAEKLRISQSAYAKYEKDDSNISLKRLEQIASELEVSVSDLISQERQPVYNFNNNSITSVANIIENLHTDNIETLQKFNTYLQQENELLKERINRLEEKLGLN